MPKLLNLNQKMINLISIDNSSMIKFSIAKLASMYALFHHSCSRFVAFPLVFSSPLLYPLVVSSSFPLLQAVPCQITRLFTISFLTSTGFLLF